MRNFLGAILDLAAMGAVAKMAFDAYGKDWVPIVVLAFVAYSFWVWFDGIRVGSK